MTVTDTYHAPARNTNPHTRTHAPFTRTHTKSRRRSLKHSMFLHILSQSLNHPLTSLPHRGLGTRIYALARSLSHIYTYNYLRPWAHSHTHMLVIILNLAALEHVAGVVSRKNFCFRSLPSDGPWPTVAAILGYQNNIIPSQTSTSPSILPKS